MEYTHELNEEGSYVFIHAQEDVTNETSVKLIEFVTEVMSRTGYRKFLVDRRNSRMKASTVDLYDRPALGDALRGLLGPAAKAAFLYTHDERDFRFFETVCQNKGLNVRVFRDRSEAERWLIGDSSR